MNGRDFFTGRLHASGVDMATTVSNHTCLTLDK